MSKNRYILVILTALTVGIFAHQGCGRGFTGHKGQEFSSDASSTNLSPEGPDLSAANKSCSFDGNAVEAGGSVLAFLNSSGTNCLSESRVCTDGVLSGSYQYSSCSQSQAGCLFGGRTIAHNQSVAAYVQSLQPDGSIQCLTENRTCNNGQLSGSFSLSQCQASAAAKSCIFDGKTLLPGDSATAYLSSTVLSPAVCQSQKRFCVDGVLSGSYAFGACVANAPAACLFGGNTYPDGADVTAYREATSPNGVCASETRHCSNGDLTGTYAFASCAQTPQSGCQFNSVLVPSGGSVKAYLASNPANATLCQAETRTCANGVLSGTYGYSQCGQNIVFNFSPVFSVNGSILGGLPMFPYKVEQIQTSSLVEVLGINVGDVVPYESLNSQPFVNGVTTSLKLFNFNILVHAPIGITKQTLLMNFSTPGKAGTQLSIDIEQDKTNTKCLNLKMAAYTLGGPVLVSFSGNFKTCEP